MQISGNRPKNVLQGFLKETFEGHVLAIRKLPMGSIKTVLDLGAHVGMYSILARFLHPGARVVAVEPSSDNYAFLKNNTKNLNVELCKKVIGSGDFVQFIESRSNVSHRFEKTKNDSDPEKNIKSFKFPDIVCDLKINTEKLFIKIDIEGAEHNFIGDVITESILRECVGINFEGHHTKEVPNAKEYIKWLQDCFSKTHEITTIAVYGRKGVSVRLLRKDVKTINPIL